MERFRRKGQIRIGIGTFQEGKGVQTHSTDLNVMSQLKKSTSDETRGSLPAVRSVVQSVQAARSPFTDESHYLVQLETERELGDDDRVVQVTQLPSIPRDDDQSTKAA